MNSVDMRTLRDFNQGFFRNRAHGTYIQKWQIKGNKLIRRYKLKDGGIEWRETTWLINLQTYKIIKG